MEYITADYYADAFDEKTKGKVAIRKDTVLAVYTFVGYKARTMVMCEGGLKFACKGTVNRFLKELSAPPSEILNEHTTSDT